MFDFSSILNAQNLIGGAGGAAGGAASAAPAASSMTSMAEPSKFRQAVDIVNQVGDMGGGQPPQNRGPQNTQEAISGITNSPFMQGLKRVAGAVASFYTGGLSGLAMNVGSQAMGKKG